MQSPETRPGRAVFRPLAKCPRRTYAYSMRISHLVLLIVALSPLLRGELVINEFLASNDNGLLDEDGDSSDWIELFNDSSESVPLDGLFFSNDPLDLKKWALPALVLGPHEYHVTFASGKDRSPVTGEWHTNFKISREMSFLALSDAQGEILSSYAPDQEQRENVSFGIAQSGRREELTIVPGNPACKWLVPSSNFELDWLDAGFNDNGWRSAKLGVGYERGSGGYDNYFGVNGNVESSMYDRHPTIYIRIPFTVEDTSNLSELTLRIRYDDGFIAYLNGRRVASANAPDSPTWDDQAPSTHDDGAAVRLEDFDISEYAGLLRADNLLCIHGLNAGTTSSDMLIDAEITGARILDIESGAPGFLSHPTPGIVNGPSFAGFVADTKFSVDRGFYDEPFSVEITTASEETEIRYTTNGDTPTSSTGLVYDGPIRISRSTTLRAAAFKEGLVPSNVDTHTYLFLDDIIDQSADGAAPSGWPGDGSVNGQAMNYGMDPDVVGGVFSRAEVIGALEDIPTISIVTDIENLFSPSSGIYVNAGGDGRSWERPASIEMLGDEYGDGFQIDAGLRIRGGFSRSGGNPKHSFRLFFRKEYGEGKLRYPLFGDEGADVFDNLDLRTSQNYSWAFQGSDNNSYVRDVFSRDVQMAMGRPSTRSRYYHLYLNGNYWGLYQSQERSEASYAETYFGGDKADYDVIKSFGAVTDGSRAAHSRLWNEARQGFASDVRYFRVQGLNPDGSPNPSYEKLLDVGNLIDYMALTYYTGDRDGPGSRYTQPRPNNFYAIFNRANPSGFKYFEHDSEHSLGTGEQNMVTPLTSGDGETQFNPHWLHEQLVDNANYRMAFADRIQKHFANGGLLTDAVAIGFIDRRASQIEKAIIAESARWGDSRRASPFLPSHWESAVEEVRAWMRGRTRTVVSQLRSQNWYPSIDAPEFNVPGGEVAEGFELFFTAGGGTVYYTTDGNDPRLANGGIYDNSETASVAGNQSFVILPEPYSGARVLVPGNGSDGLDWIMPDFDDEDWREGSSAIGYDENNDYVPLIEEDIDSEMNGVNTSVYMRIPFNVSGPVDFSGLQLLMKYDDGFVAYLNGTRVASDNAPSNPVWNSDATNNHDDGLAVNSQVFDITSHLNVLTQGKNTLAFHGLNAGLGSSDFLIRPRLEGIRVSGGAPVNLTGDRVVVKSRSRSSTGEWSALSEAVFLHGAAEASHLNLGITEIMYHPPKADDAEAAAGFSEAKQFEFIELMNYGDTAIDLSGVEFAVGIRHVFEEATMLAPGERLVLVSDAEAFRARYGDEIPVAGVFEGNLDNSGERLLLRRVHGGPVLWNFRYDDMEPWPVAADGGASLEFGELTPDADMSDPLGWHASASAIGSPGTDGSDLPEPSPVEKWMTLHSIANLTGDADDDQLANLIEYVYGSNPNDGTDAPPLEVKQVEGEIELAHPVNLEALDAEAILEQSGDLGGWTEVTPLAVNDEVRPSGVRRMYRVNAEQTPFFRLRLRITNDQ